jgi:hypothetical protein
MDEFMVAIEDVVIRTTVHYDGKEGEDKQYAEALMECINSLKWLLEHERRIYRLVSQLRKLQANDDET